MSGQATRVGLPGAGTALFFNPRAADFQSDPYAHYDRLRELDPVHRSPWGVWFVGKHEHVRSILKDRRFRSQDVPGQLRRRNAMLKERRVAANQPDNLDALIANSENWFAFLDGMEHTRLRKLVTHAFQKRQLEQMRSSIQAAIINLLDGLADRTEFDFMNDFAKPLPQHVMAQLLGLPASDVPRCVAWVDKIARIFDPLLSLEEYASLNQCSIEFMDYLRDLVAARRAAPQQGLISALIEAHEQDDRLSGEEIISTLIMMFAAGEETTVGMLGNGTLALLQHPGQCELLLQQPDLIGNAVEELLRYDAAFQMTSRTALEDVELGGKAIRQGDQIYVLLASANRDPERFASPDTLDITRDKPQHMSFADGWHVCVGAQLARMEIQEALLALFTRFPALTLAPQTLHYRSNTVLRCLTGLTVSTGATGSQQISRMA